MAITFIEGTEAIGATEHSLATDTSYDSGDAQTTNGAVSLFLDLSDMVAGDELEIKLYEKTRSGDSQILHEQWNLTGARSKPGWPSPTFMLGRGWDWTAKTIAGTSITVNWSIRISVL